MIKLFDLIVCIPDYVWTTMFQCDTCKCVCIGIANDTEKLKMKLEMAFLNRGKSFHVLSNSIAEMQK